MARLPGARSSFVPLVLCALSACGGGGGGGGGRGGGGGGGAGTPDPPTPMPQGNEVVTIVDADRAKNIEIQIFYPAASTGTGTAPDDAYGPYPLVVFGHGRNGISPVPPNYTEYDWLYSDLASRGYVVVTLNLDPNSNVPSTLVGSQQNIRENAEDFKAAIDHMIAENARTGSPYKGLVKTSRIATVGHSRGGEGALVAAQEDTRVTCAVGMGQTDFFEMTIDRIPALCFTASYDCDTGTLMQQKMYQLRFSPWRAIVMVEKGEHFQWCDTATIFCETHPDKIARADQHSITLEYLRRFVGGRLKDRKADRDWFALPDSRGVALADLQFESRDNPPAKMVDSFGDADTTTNNLTYPVGDDGTLASDTEPTDSGAGMKFRRVQWNGTGDFWWSSLNNGTSYTDASAQFYVLFRVRRNSGGTFTVRITDKEGDSASLPVGDSLPNGLTGFWQSANLTLADFKAANANLNVGRLAEVRLVFDGSSSGQIDLEDLKFE